MRKTGPRLLLVLGGTILAFALGEILVRVFWDSLRPYRDVEIEYPVAYPAPVTGLVFGFKPESRFAAASSLLTIVSGTSSAQASAVA